MGTPGYALLCSKGHLVCWWDEHLYWTDEMLEAKNKAKENGCICGDKQVIEIAHYGGINDCICLDTEVDEKGIKATGRFDEFTVPDHYAVDRDGKPIEGVFHKVRLPVYFIPENVKKGR